MACVARSIRALEPGPQGAIDSGPKCAAEPHGRRY